MEPVWLYMIVPFRSRITVCGRSEVEAPDRLKIVINRIMPEKTTNISVSDLLDAFEEYECVGKISFSPDVIRAVNKG